MKWWSKSFKRSFCFTPSFPQSAASYTRTCLYVSFSGMICLGAGNGSTDGALGSMVKGLKTNKPLKHSMSHDCNHLISI